MLNIAADGNALLLPVKVVPGASRTRLMGEWNGRARIAVAAPPEKGKANDALVTFLSKYLNLRKRDVNVVSGLTSSVKMIRIEGVAEPRLREALRPDRS